MTKDITIEHSTRQQIAEFLPEAIRLAVRSYREFMETEEYLDKDANIMKRQFATHHKEAKIAISHIELLIKLARWADLPDKTIIGDAEAIYLQGLMALRIG